MKTEDNHEDAKREGGTKKVKGRDDGIMNQGIVITERMMQN